MSEQLEQLKSIFHDIFQLDQADLDFGIYRIMRQKRDEVDKYIKDNLVRDLNHSFDKYNVSIAEDIQRQINEARNNAIALGFDPEASPRVKELEQTLSNLKQIEVQKESVLSDLVQFLGRYYKDGDFLSLPRYRKNSYAIEYNGEEVKLHWANADQYYVKTAERFRDYRFLLPDGKAVHFKITAANTETGNNKTETGKERRFQLLETDFMKEENGELLIFFRYAADEQKRKQADINEETITRILEEGKNFIEWRKALSQTAPTEKNKTRTLLEKHLTDYTARNTFDYFIHKDLEGFLRRELDFYIKNEIVMLDDIENEDAPRVELYLAKVKSLRRIGHKLIAFLAQVENFCKKLFLKKKFVIRAEYCATLDRVPRELWMDVLANEAQIQEWHELYAIDEIEGNLINGNGKLNEQFLEANQNLIIDTRHFSDDWKLKLLASFDDLDTDTDGLLIKSDNFHALHILTPKYSKEIKTVYIDPPYNTEKDRQEGKFLYKDGYEHSSWLSMMENRLSLATRLLNQDGTFFTSINDVEQAKLKTLMDEIFGESNLASQIIVQSNKRGQTYKQIARTHEYLLCYVKSDDASLSEIEKGENNDLNYSDDIGAFSIRELRNRNPKFGRFNRPNLYFPIYVNPESKNEEGFCSISLEKNENFSEEALPKNSEGEDSCWRWSEKKIKKQNDTDIKKANLVAKQTREGKWNIYEKYRKTTYKIKSIWTDKEVISEKGTKELGDLGLEKEFAHPKPLGLLEKCVQLSADEESIVLDFYAGSATTGHAVINHNRDLEDRVKYILVETNEYFDSITLPRIKKAIYSSDWKDGKPVSREGSSQLLKYFALESYEDSINNLALTKSDEIDQAKLKFTNEFQEDYLLNYMLEFETKGSQSLLNFDNFSAPFDYKMKIAVDGVGETRETPIDLVETFNYLIGLYVEKIQQIDGFRVVRGKTRKGERCLILWRTTKDLKQELADKRLNDFLEKAEFDFSKIDTLYINGDAAIPIGRIRRETDTWQIKMIEAEFMKRMFE